MTTPAPVEIQTHRFPLTAALSILIACIVAFALFLVIANLLSRAGKRRR
jgi:hypothetical protein